MLLVNFKKIKFCLSATEQGKMRGRVKRFIQNFLDTFYSLSKSIEGVGVDFTDLIIVERKSGYLKMILKLMKSNYLQLRDRIL